MSGKIYYWFSDLAFPKESAMSEEQLCQIAGAEEYLQQAFYFFVEEGCWAHYYRLGAVHKAWFSTAKEAYDFLTDGVKNGSLIDDGIELPTGEIVKPPYLGGDYNKWEELGK